MLPNDTKVLHASHQGVHVLRFVGEIRYTLSPALEQFITGLFSGLPPAGFVVDLTDTTSIDSTNLGLLADIAKRMRKCGGPPVILVSHRTEINEVLVSMGFNEVFTMVPNSESDLAADHELELNETSDATTMASTLLKAHRTLMALNEHNRDQFHDVVSALEEEITIASEHDNQSG